MGPLATLVARGVFYLPLELKLADGDRCAVARHWPLSREPRMKNIILEQMGPSTTPPGRWSSVERSCARSMREGRAGTAHPKWGDAEAETLHRRTLNGAGTRSGTAY